MRRARLIEQAFSPPTINLSGDYIGYANRCNGGASTLAKCSRYRLVNLHRKARFNIRHRIAECQFQMRVT
jgi:hypothetical protein